MDIDGAVLFQVLLVFHFTMEYTLNSCINPATDPLRSSQLKQGRTVLEAKRFGCYTCHPDTSLVDVVKKMVSEDVSCIVVVDHSGCLAGIITRNDVLRGYLTNAAWQQALAGQYMTEDVITALPEDQLSTVANLLLEHHIHRVVIVREENDKRKPLAVVSETDLIYHMMKEIE